MLVTYSLPKEQLTDGLIGSILFGTLAGTISLAIPTKQKIIFVPITLSISLILAVIFGIYNNSSG